MLMVVPTHLRGLVETAAPVIVSRTWHQTMIHGMMHWPHLIMLFPPVSFLLHSRKFDLFVSKKDQGFSACVQTRVCRRICLFFVVCPHKVTRQSGVRKEVRPSNRKTLNHIQYLRLLNGETFEIVH